MVERFAPNVTWFKSKRSCSSDYFAAKPDKAVPKAVPKVVPKVVLCKALTLYLIGLLVFLRILWCPEEDVELYVFPFSYRRLFQF